MSTFVSIVVPAYNEADNIAACANALIEQEFPDNDYEIIVVDNNSSDNTLEIIKNFPVRNTIQYKQGRAAAKNAGVKLATGDLIVFIDADCVATKKWLKNIVFAFDNPGIGCVAGEIKPLRTDDLTAMERFLIEKGHLSPEHHMRHPFLPFVVTANAAYRREIFDAIGLFDEGMFGEDADFSWRMQLHTNYKVAYAPEAVVFHPYEVKATDIFKQKRRHAFGSVMLYKKYKQYRQAERKSVKRTYWEYCSIMRRWRQLLIHKLKTKMLGTSNISAPVDECQLILETAWKVGLIHGSLKHRVWYV